MKTTGMERSRYSMVALATLCVASPVVYAEGEGSGIPQIVVTAERREAAAQDVGQAIVPVTSDALDRFRIESIADLTILAPNFLPPGGALPQPSLRGVSSDVFTTGVESGLALHINGVYVPQFGIANNDFFDMEAIEILYGPQGTLFGRATNGGIFNFITKKPGDEQELEAEAEFNSLNQLRVKAIYNAPALMDGKLRLRLAAMHEVPDDSFEATGPNGFQQDLSSSLSGHGTSVRFSAALDFTESLTAEAIFQYIYDDTPGAPIRQLGDFTTYPAPVAATGFPVNVNGPGSGMLDAFGRYSQFLNGGGISPDYTGTSGFLDICSDAVNAAAGLASCAAIWGPATPNPSDPSKIGLNRPQFQESENIFSMIRLTWDIGENHSLTSTSSFQDLNYRFGRDDDQSTLDAKFQQFTNPQTTYGQELLLTGTVGRFDYVVGANYTYDEQPNFDSENFNYQILSESQFYNVFNFDFSLDKPMGVAYSADTPIFTAKSDVTTKYIGIFGNVDIRLTERLTVSGGLRYSETRRRFQEDTRAIAILTCAAPELAFFGLSCAAFPFVGLNPATDVFRFNFANIRDVRQNYDSITWTASAKYDATDNTLVYARVSQAEQHGGIHFVTEPWDSEKITAYELGSKSLTLDDRLLVNTSVFYYDYNDKFLDLPAPIGLNGGVTNVPSARVFGGELAVIARPKPELQIAGSLGYLNAEYDDTFISRDDGVAPDCPINGSDCLGTDVDLDGLSLARSPKFTIAFSVTYDLDLGWGIFSPQIEHRWQDELFYSQFENPLDRQGAYHLTNIRLRLTLSEEKAWFEAYCNNLQNNDDIVTNLEGRSAVRQVFLAEGRHCGGRVGVRFF